MSIAAAFICFYLEDKYPTEEEQQLLLIFYQQFLILVIYVCVCIHIRFCIYKRSFDVQVGGQVSIKLVDADPP